MAPSGLSAAPDKFPSVQRARSVLLQGLAAVANQSVGDWPQALARAAAPHGLSLHWRGLLSEPPGVAAVRATHALEMGQPGLQAWYARWPAGMESAALQFAAAAVGMLAGRESLQILAAAVTGDGGDAGALIDGESCARMSVAGFDPETEVRLGNCAELLASAGDLVNLPARVSDGVEPTPCLILGLKWHAPTGD